LRVQRVEVLLEAYFDLAGSQAQPARASARAVNRTARMTFTVAIGPRLGLSRSLNIVERIL
jgi:hypothetical protein